MSSRVVPVMLQFPLQDVRLERGDVQTGNNESVRFLP